MIKKDDKIEEKLEEGNNYIQFDEWQEMKKRSLISLFCKN